MVKRKRPAKKTRFTKKTLEQLRADGDVWRCPVCRCDNVYSIRYITSVLAPRSIEALLRSAHVESIDELPVVTGSAFEDVCGACRVNVAPRKIGGRPNPILHPVYTHGED